MQKKLVRIDDEAQVTRLASLCDVEAAQVIKVGEQSVAFVVVKLVDQESSC